jgi:hypothetical protein
MNSTELTLIVLAVVVCLACVGYCLFTVRLNYKLYTEYFKDRSMSNRKSSEVKP